MKEAAGHTELPTGDDPSADCARLVRTPGAPTVMSLFSGGGGLDLGLELAGFESRACVEIEKYACKTLRENRGADLGDGRAYLAGAEIIEGSVTDVTGAGFLRAAGLRKGEATVLAGGPPCTTFSVAGRRAGLTSETGRLFEHYVRLLKAVKPQALIYENVKGLMSAVDENGEPGGAFRKIHDAIEAEGYSLTWRSINMANYGIPQTRERVIIIGLRGDKAPTFPEPTHYDPDRPRTVQSSYCDPWVDVRAALDGLPPAAAPGTKQPPVPNHVARRHTESTMKSYAATPPGQRNEGFKRDRLRWDRPSKVIRAQGKVKANGSGQKNSNHQAIHPDEPRQLTPREAARIQTFPDSYWLDETFVNSYRVVGDAVPPEFGRLLGTHLLAQIPAARRRVLV